PTQSWDEKKKQLRESIEFYKKALPVREKLVEDDPEDLQCQRDLARNYGFMGDSLLSLKLYKEAKEAYKKAKDIRVRTVEQARRRPRAEFLAASRQHARDFGNFADYFVRTGDREAALEQMLHRLAYYAKRPFAEGDLLRGEFITDRAETRAGA